MPALPPAFAMPETNSQQPSPVGVTENGLMGTEMVTEGRRRGGRLQSPGPAQTTPGHMIASAKVNGRSLIIIRGYCFSNTYFWSTIFGFSPTVLAGLEGTAESRHHLAVRGQRPRFANIEQHLGGIFLTVRIPQFEDQRARFPVSSRAAIILTLLLGVKSFLDGIRSIQDVGHAGCLSGDRNALLRLRNGLDIDAVGRPVLCALLLFNFHVPEKSGFTASAKAVQQSNPAATRSFVLNNVHPQSRSSRCSCGGR
ncbi:MAG: hypothetical protein WDO73_37885 [Ignavibacteriota bacterium]